MRAAAVSVIALALVGCASPTPRATPPVFTAALTGEPTRSPATLPADSLSLDLDPQSCVCDLSQVDVALMALPGVSRLDWDAGIWRVTLFFLDDRRPSDSEIREAMNATDVRLKAIHRP